MSRTKMVSCVRSSRLACCVRTATSRSSTLRASRSECSMRRRRSPKLVMTSANTRKTKKSGRSGRVDVEGVQRLGEEVVEAQAGKADGQQPGRQPRVPDGHGDGQEQQGQLELLDAQRPREDRCADRRDD